jgi:putative membrane protein
MKLSTQFLALACVLTLPFSSAFSEEAKTAAAGPTDSEIAHIVVTANAIDIDAGKLAKNKTKNKEVKEFAQLMMTDHAAVNKQATDLAKKLKVTPKDNATSDSLTAGAKENIANLKKLKGGAFDQAYVNHEVVYHEAVLNAIDQTLVPSAKNEELKALIVKVRPAFVAHLEHAKMLQSKLNSAPAKK